MYHFVLELLALMHFFFINLYGTYKKRFSFILLYWVCVLYAFYWELHGTGFQWSYPGYSFYLWGKIPLALIFGWCWWIFYIVLVSAWLRVKLNLTLWYHPIVVDWFVATLFGGVLENIAVYFGWWTYAVANPPLLPYVSFNVWLGWALPVVVVIQMSRWLYENISRKKPEY